MTLGLETRYIVYNMVFFPPDHPVNLLEHYKMQNSSCENIQVIYLTAQQYSHYHYVPVPV